MAQRNQQSQSLHDAVIAGRDLAWQGDSRYVRSWTNPGSQHNANYKLNGVEQFPDIIVKIKTSDGETQIGVEEVETSDSVNANEVQQWKNYAALSEPSWFILLVPSSSVAQAKKLAKGLSLFVAGYSHNEKGNLMFSEAEAP